jgi:heterodisulfide reductase subunit B2
MKYLYYPGCSLKSTGRAYGESLEAVFKKLDIKMDEINDWNCCGATSYFSMDEVDAFALAARNLALAENQAADGTINVIAPCSACYLVLLKTEKFLEGNPEVSKKINSRLDRAGLHYNGRVNVRHPLDVLVNDFGLENIAKNVKVPLKGMKVACYYGCQMIRPYATFDDQYHPESMEKLVKALGADPVEWSMKTRCCGGSLTGTIQEAGLRLNRTLLKDVQRSGASIVLTCCPLCQHNMECYQERINRKYEEDFDIPVVYFTQLMGIALGLSEEELSMNRLFKKPSLKRFTSQKGAMANAW